MSRLLWALGLLSLLPPAAIAGQNEGQSMPSPTLYEEHELDNGLRIITHEDHSAPIVNLQLWYHVGSKNEQEGRTGFAHMFEHLMFKGSDNVRPEQHDDFITRVGGIANAYTTEDATVYWESVPSNYLEMILWLEADRMRSLDVSEENFFSEREVVKEERRLRIESPPYGDVFEMLYTAAYDVHPYGHLAIGSMEDLDAATIDDVRSFYETYYSPGNAYLVLAGNFETDSAMEWVEEYFGGIPSGEDVIPRVEVREPERGEERRIERQKAVPLPAYIAGYFIPEDGHPDSYPLTLAGSILAQGRSSRLYQSLIYEKQLAVQADAFSSVREHPNLFMAILIMNQGAALEDGEAALNDEFRRMMEEPVSDDELEKAKNQIRSSYITGMQTVQDKAGALGHAAVIHQDTATVDNEFELFMKVTKEDIMRVMGKYLDPSNRTVVTVLPPAGLQHREERQR